MHYIDIGTYIPYRNVLLLPITFYLFFYILKWKLAHTMIFFFLLTLQNVYMYQPIYKNGIVCYIDNGSISYRKMKIERNFRKPFSFSFFRRKFPFSMYFNVFTLYYIPYTYFFLFYWRVYLMFVCLSRACFYLIYTIYISYIPTLTWTQHSIKIFKVDLQLFKNRIRRKYLYMYIILTY